MALKIQFTVVYDWLARRRDISWHEKIIICHILRFGHNGCFKSYTQIGRDLGLDRVTVIRVTKRLIERLWVVPVPGKKRERKLYINQAMLDDMPLLAGVKGCGIVLETGLRGSGAAPPMPPEGSGAAPPGSGAAPPAGSGAAPPGVNRNRRESLLVENSVKREESQSLFLASVMRERTLLTPEQFEKRRQECLKQLLPEKK